LAIYPTPCCTNISRRSSTYCCPPYRPCSTFSDHRGILSACSSNASIVSYNSAITLGRRWGTAKANGCRARYRGLAGAQHSCIDGIIVVVGEVPSHHDALRCMAVWGSGNAIMGMRSSVTTEQPSQPPGHSMKLHDSPSTMQTFWCQGRRWPC